MVPISDAQELIREVPELKCECKYCKEMDILNTPEKYIKTDHLKMHYILSRWNEKQKSIDEVLEDLDNIIKILEEKELFDLYWEFLYHLTNWYDVLQEYAK